MDSVRTSLFSPFIPTNSGFSTRHRVHRAERVGELSYPYGQGTTSYVEGVPTLYLSSATCRCQGCTAEIDGPQRKSIIEGEDEYNACIAALKTWNNRYSKQ